MNGFLNILKPPGMSSHDVVNAVRRIFSVKKVGHAGTLDPAAAGVLPVAVGKATRLIEYLELADKSYRAEIDFRYATTTGDVYGELAIKQTQAFSLTKEQLETVFAKFRGTIIQSPPSYSAIKIGGQRAYELARAGKDVIIPEREVTIHALHLVECDRTKCLINVTCSKGTYIRSLIEDIGKALRLPATMTFLLRTRVGDFVIADSCSLEELAEVGAQAMLVADKCLTDYPCYELRTERVNAFFNGLSTTEKNPTMTEGVYLVYNEGVFLGMGRYDKAQEEMFPVKIFR